MLGCLLLHDNIQLHYISVLLVLKDQRRCVGSNHSLLTGRLEALLRKLVGYVWAMDEDI